MGQENQSYGPAFAFSKPQNRPDVKFFDPAMSCPTCGQRKLTLTKPTQEYIDRAMAPLRAAFPPQIVRVMEEQMSGPCTAEVAAFDRFTDFSVYANVVTACLPSGQTAGVKEVISFTHLPD